MSTTTYPATQKQFDFIKRLLSERQVDEKTQELVDAARQQAVAGTLRSRTASLLIDELMALPRKTDERDRIDAGIYAVDGDMIVRVYLGQQSGQMLAKQVHLELGDVSYTYLGMARKVLGAASTWTRLELNEVGALGITSGHCLICGRRLDDPESVDRGIGPVCAQNY
jgi:hypothetical protein